MISQSIDHTRKYRVCSAPAGWRVERAGDCLGVFADPAEAIGQACRSARSDADDGQLAIVTAETATQEFHCYVPRGDRPAAASTSLPPYLRLMVTR